MHQELHALHGMMAELGELNGIYQKFYQGHPVDEAHLQKELGDLFWFAAELCTVRGWKMDDIAITNITKLQSRYPDGFEADRSLHRAEGDV